MPFTKLTIVISMEVEVGIIAACAPAIRPGYVWLYPKIASSLWSSKSHSSKGHTKLSDEVRLKKFSAEPIVHAGQGFTNRTLGNDVSVDTEWDAPVSPYDQIHTTRQVDIERGPPAGGFPHEDVKF